jgi:hypothetical protein
LAKAGAKPRDLSVAARHSAFFFLLGPQHSHSWLCAFGLFHFRRN